MTGKCHKYYLLNRKPGPREPRNKQERVSDLVKHVDSVSFCHLYLQAQPWTCPIWNWSPRENQTKHANNTILPFLSSSTALDVSHLELETCDAPGKTKQNLPFFHSFWFPFPTPQCPFPSSSYGLYASPSLSIHSLLLEVTANNIMQTFFLMSFYSVFKYFFFFAFYT